MFVYILMINTSDASIYRKDRYIVSIAIYRILDNRILLIQIIQSINQSIMSGCLEPQPQKLDCRLLTASLAVPQGGWCWKSGVVVVLSNRRRGSADQGNVVRRHVERYTPE